MSDDSCEVKRLFLAAPLATGGGGTECVSLDDVERFVEVCDAQSAVVPEWCSPYELIFRFVPGLAPVVCDSTRDMLLATGVFCGYGALPDEFLSSEQRVLCGDGVIAAGRYFFVQSLFGGAEKIRSLAESLLLESLWDEVSLSADEVFVRVLKESEGWVSQVIWRLVE